MLIFSLFIEMNEWVAGDDGLFGVMLKQFPSERGVVDFWPF